MYRGVIVPLVTPLGDDGAVCEESLGRLIESVRPHVTALLPALSSGEGWRLSERQWRDVVSLTVRLAGGLPVLAGIQMPGTAEVVERTRIAVELGASAVVVTTPFSKSISQAEIQAHYRTVLREGGAPLFLYNEKALSGNDIEIETLVELCRLPDVVGVKESSGVKDLTRRLSSQTRVPVFQGWENLLWDSPGMAGCIVPLANLEPRLCGDMLVEPCPTKQARINALCEEHGLFREDWFLGLKRELRRRGLLSTVRCVSA